LVVRRCSFVVCVLLFFFSSRRRHTRCYRDWSSDVCSSDLTRTPPPFFGIDGGGGGALCQPKPISCYSLATTHSITRRAHTHSLAYPDDGAAVHSRSSGESRLLHRWTIPSPGPAGQRPDRVGLIGWCGPGPYGPAG